MSSVNHEGNIIEVENVSFSYGKEEILSNVTLEIHKGDYLGIIGPNGAGKTTLLKLMLGLLPLQSGSVKLFGENLRDFKGWHKIGYVPQKATSFDVNFPATVLEVVTMGRYGRLGIAHRVTEKDKAIVERCLKRVGIWELKDKLIGDLSGGQEQRVFIGRALATEPEVIFLDEPTTGVDEKAQNEFYELLKKLNQEFALTLILVSHDIGRITKEVMRIACIDKVLCCHVSPEEYIKASPLLSTAESVKIITPHHH